jgi:murein DD-endopeptidase MepM/ murein hydrolase activator NlpD
MAPGTQGREVSIVEVGEYPYEVQRITLEGDTHVNLSAADLARVRLDQKAVGALWNSSSSRRFGLPLGPPLRSLPTGGRFGARRYFNDQPRSPHTGTDFAAPSGSEVLSTAAGRVVLSDDLFFSGQSIFVDHGDGLVSMYFHLRERAVEIGDEVIRGEVIGRVGQTGRATGPHLHFGLRWRGARIDPALMLMEPAALVDLK